MNATKEITGLLLVLLLHCTLSELLCELSLNTILYKSFRHEEIIGCQSHGTNPFHYEVKNLSKEVFHEFRSRLFNYEKVWVSISGGLVDKNTASITVPPNATITAIPRQQEPRRLSKSNGILSVLMLRVIALDSEPDFSAEELYNLTFVDDASLKGQMGKCSFGKLQIVPTEYGVLEVQIDMNATGIKHGLLVDEAYKVAATLVNEDVDSVRDLVDGVMVVVPPGTLGGWAAFGSLNGKHSSYNNRWAGYLGATMHEIGHNLGLHHAYENGVEYEEQTGYMGNVPQQMHFPRKCYNGQNHWHLGWYADRTLELNFEDETLSRPINVKIAAFVDYDTTTDEHYIIVKAGDFYLQYNRAKKFNAETSEMQDMVTIVELSKQGTNLVAGLDRESPFWRSKIVDKQIVVEVCRTDVSSEPNFIEISIGHEETDCGNVPTSRPSPSSAPVPQRTPFDLPSYQRTSPTRLPTLTPSMVPTWYLQNGSIDPGTVTEAPTFIVEEKPAAQVAKTNGAESKGPSRSPTTNISTTDVHPFPSQGTTVSVVKIVVMALTGAFVVIMLCAIYERWNRRKRIFAGRNLSKQDDSVQLDNHVVETSDSSPRSNEEFDYSTSSLAFTEGSPNISMEESFNEERCQQTDESAACQVHAQVGEIPTTKLPRPAERRGDTCINNSVNGDPVAIHARITPRSKLRIESGFLSQPGKNRALKKFGPPRDANCNFL